jgi:hypothetical protein
MRVRCLGVLVCSLVVSAFAAGLASSAFAQGCIDINACNPATLNGILFVDGVKHKSLASAIDACPQTCWIIDSFQEKFVANPFANIGSKSVKVTLGRGTWLTTVAIIVPTKSQLEGSGRGDPGFSGTVIQADASFPPNTPIVEMGNAATSMGVRVENLTIDCNNIAGCIGLQNVRSQEQSGARHVLIENITGVGLDVEGSAAQNSGPYEDMEFAGGIDFNVNAASLCARIVNVPAFRGLHGATCNFNNYEVHPAVGIEMDSPGTLNDIHIEGANTGIGVGIAYPGTGAILQNVFGGGPNMSALVHVYSGSEILLTGLVRSTTPVLLIHNGHSMRAGSVAFYVVHNGGHNPPGAGVFSSPVAAAVSGRGDSGGDTGPSRFSGGASAESFDMLERMSVYSGSVGLDANGEADVRLPEGFQSTGRQFHYQLTPVGGAASLYVAREITGNSFHIAGGKPGLKVSWQVTAIRSADAAN